MGYSLVAAAAVVFLAGFVAAFALTDMATESAREVDAAWRDAQDRGVRALRTQADVTSVSSKQGTLTIKVLNTGAAAIDAGEVNLLLNGVLATIATRNVDGAATDVWAPGKELRLTVATGTPTTLSLVGPDGPLASWRS